MSGGTWQARLAESLVAGGVELAAWVPDKRLSPVADALSAHVPVRTLTSEEACIGYAAGARAAGRLPAVLFQCSGLGNALNALGSLALPYGLGFPIALSMRGTLGERNPAQTLLGKTTTSLLAALGIQAFPVATADRIPVVVHGTLALAEGAREVSAIVLDPELDAA